MSYFDFKELQCLNFREIKAEFKRITSNISSFRPIDIRSFNNRIEGNKLKLKYLFKLLYCNCNYNYNWDSKCLKHYKKDLFFKNCDLNYENIQDLIKYLYSRNKKHNPSYIIFSNTKLDKKSHKLIGKYFVKNDIGINKIRFDEISDNLMYPLAKYIKNIPIGKNFTICCIEKVNYRAIINTSKFFKLSQDILNRSKKRNRSIYRNRNFELKEIIRCRGFTKVSYIRNLNVLRIMNGCGGIGFIE